MDQHLFKPLMWRACWMAAALAMSLLTGPTAPAAAELAPRSVVFRPLVQDPQPQAWGPFTFGMGASEAAQAALQSGGRLVPSVGAAGDGQLFTYHGPSRARDRRRAAADYALVWFDEGQLSRVTVVLHRQALTRIEACLATHRRTVAHVLASGGAVTVAATGDDLQRGPDQAQQHAGESRDATWAAEVQRSGSRAVVETSWEEPASATQAGTDETCIATVTYLPE